MAWRTCRQYGCAHSLLPLIFDNFLFHTRRGVVFVVGFKFFLFVNKTMPNIISTVQYSRNVRAIEHYENTFRLLVLCNPPVAGSSRRHFSSHTPFQREIRQRISHRATRFPPVPTPVSKTICIQNGHCATSGR